MPYNHPELSADAVAVPTGKYKGRQWYRVPVSVTVVDTHALRERSASFTVLAPSAAAAADYARDMFATVPCSNIRATGPRGGLVRRFVGWESAIGARMFAPRAPVQLDAFAEGAQ